MKKFPIFGLFVGAVVLIAGCAKVPEEAIQSTSLLIDDARSQDANVYAPEIFSAAQDSFQAAQTEIELQKGKFALSRNYDVAERLLTSATQLAREASETGTVRKDEMRTETENLLLQAKEEAATAQDLLKRAPTGKEGRIALVAIKADVDSLSGMFAEVENLLSRGDVKSAHDQVQIALSRAQGLTQELQSAIDKSRPGSRRG